VTVQNLTAQMTLLSRYRLSAHWPGFELASAVARGAQEH